jgi:hypothetical protein
MVQPEFLILEVNALTMAWWEVGYETKLNQMGE